MRYRALDQNGDATFGASQQNFLINTPEAVAQGVRTRLGLLRGEWFLDKTEGMPWSTEVIGVRTRPTYDRAIRDRILGSQGVTSIISYSSQVVERSLRVQVRIDTIYGPIDLEEVL